LKKKNTRTIEHQFNYGNREYICDPEFPKSKKNDYFPNKSSIRLLSEILASVIKMFYVDGLPFVISIISSDGKDEDNVLYREKVEENESISEENDQNKKSSSEETGTI
jgi:hypothetical protein